MPPSVTRDSYAFIAVNTSKRGVTLNLKTARGRELLRALVERSDVVVENFATGVLERLELGYDQLRRINPRLIYACSRGFGESGKNAHVRSNASVNLAMTGWHDHVDHLSGVRPRPALGIGDEAAGVSLAVGICAALYERERTGRGRRIEVSMQEALLGFMTAVLHGHFEGITVGTAPFPCVDGDYVIFLPGFSDANIAKLFTAIGQPDKVADPRFANRTARVEHAAELEELVGGWMRRKTRREVWDTLSAVGVSSGPVLGIEEVLRDPHLESRKAFRTVVHPDAGPVTLVAPWIRFSDWEPTIASAPTLGRDNESVYGEDLGLSREEIAELKELEVI
jgi:crotonobetainyl-CoA:carnitine CoA-transferase CaiB-like acyl-CoA transferase